MSRCVLYLFLLFYFLLLAFAHRFLISRHWTSMMRNMSKFAAFVFCSVSVVQNETMFSCICGKSTLDVFQPSLLLVQRSTEPCTLLWIKKLHIVVCQCPLVQHKFCIDRLYIFDVNPSHHRPNTREKTHKYLIYTSSIILPQTMARKKRGPSSQNAAHR